jgi:hypothetical protein
MTDKNSKQKQQKQIRQANIVEALKDIGGGATKTFANDVVKETGAEFMRQLLGLKARTKASGQLERGQSFEPAKAITGEYQQTQKLQKQVRFERRILEEEKAAIESKNNQLQLQLHAITEEIKAVVVSTPKLAKEIQVARLTSGNKPDIYHLLFLQKILESLKDFRRNIENASIWLTATNKRANKKNFWNQYKTQKGTALLNPETYNSRSAG